MNDRTTILPRPYCRVVFGCRLIGANSLLTCPVVPDPGDWSARQEEVRFIEDDVLFIGR